MNNHNILITAGLLIASSIAGVAERQYNVIIEDLDGNRNEFRSDRVQSILFDPAPIYKNISTFVAGSYSESNGLGYYNIELASGKLDDEKNPTRSGGMYLYLPLTNDKCVNLGNPDLLPGYYVAGNGREALTFDVGKAIVRVNEGGEVKTIMLTDGTVDIRCLSYGGKYDIRIEAQTLNGPINIRYIGYVEFPGTTGEIGTIHEDVDVEFDKASAYYYGNWYHTFADNVIVSFSAPHDDNGYEYKLNVELYTPCDRESEKPQIANGTYTADERDEILFNSNLPFSFVPGTIDSETGEYRGTYLDRAEYFGRTSRALIKSGTIVRENGEWVMELTTETGETVKGRFGGNLKISDLRDYTLQPERPYSNLRRDRTMRWVADTKLSIVNQGKTLRGDCNTVVLTVGPEGLKGGDKIVLTMLLTDEMMSESGDIVEGTYQVSALPEAGKVLAGTLDLNLQPLYTWYYDLDTLDAIKHPYIKSCITGGEITISPYASATTGSPNDKYLIKFNLTDDYANDITGQYIYPLTPITP